MPDGVVDIGIANKDGGRSVIKTLSDIQAKAKTLFKGVDAKQLSASLKEVNSDIKRTEAEAKKAQSALDALTSGQKTPASIAAMEKDLIKAEQQVEKLSRGYDKMLAEVDRYSEFQGLNPKYNPEARKYEEAMAALERYEREFEAADVKAQKLRSTLDSLKQNPTLTPEAAQYNETLSRTGAKLTELKEKQVALNAEVERNKAINAASSKSVVAGLGKIEARISRLAKRVLFFSLITMALRNFRKQVTAAIQADSALSASLAQVKGNLATAFGAIWTAILPALRTLVNWLAIATRYIAAFISWLTGKSFKQGQEAFKAMNAGAAGTAANTGKIGKAAKKTAKALQRMLLPFDQMNILSKDSADGGAGGGAGGGGAGGGAGGLGIEYPKEMDTIIGKFEAFKDLIFLIGAAFAAWKLTPIIASLLKITGFLGKLSVFSSIASIALGIFELVSGLRNLVKVGPNVNNICQILGGALLIIGGALTLILGPIGLVVSAIGLLVVAFRHLYNNVKGVREFVDNAIKEVGKTFKDKGLVAGVIEIGGQIIAGLLKGIRAGMKKVGPWIKKNVVDRFIKWVKKKFGIASPAKTMLVIGKEIIAGILQGMLNALKNIGKWISDNVFKPIKEALFGDGEDKEGLFVSIGAKFSETKESLEKKWDDLKSGLKDAWTTVKNKFEETKSSISKKWYDIKSGLQEAWTVVKNKFEETKATLTAKWNSIKSGLQDAWATVKTKFEDTKATIADKWTVIRSGIQTATAVIITKFSKTKEALASEWLTLTAGIISKVVTISLEVKEAVAGALTKFKSTWDSIYSKTSTLTGAAVSTAVNSLKKTWDSISNKTATLTGKLAGVAQKTLDNYKKSWEAIKNKTSTLSVNIKAAVSGAYNKTARTINDLINKLPKSVRPSWRLPYLAQGAVIPPNKEFLAVLGDQKRGTNIEAPLQTIVDAFNTALVQSGMNGAGVVNVYLQGDAKQLFRVVRTEANNYTQSTGKAAFNL